MEIEVNFKKSALLLLLVLVLAFSFTSCGSEQKSVSMFDLQEKMTSADSSLPAMSSANSSADDAEELFTYISDMSYDKIEGYFVAYSKKGKADEIAVINVKNSSDVSTAEKSIRDHVNGRIKLYKQYDPTQTKRVENAVIFTHKNFCVLIISNNSSKVKQAFLDFVA